MGGEKRDVWGNKFKFLATITGSHVNNNTITNIKFPIIINRYKIDQLKEQVIMKQDRGKQ